MKGRTFLNSASRSVFRGWSLCVLIVLGVAVIGWGQQGQAGRSGRRARRPSQLKVIQLPTPTISSATSVEQALARQQSLEAPADLRLTFSEIGQLVWAAQGVAVPQAGSAAIPDALIPMKVYVVLPDGVYLYSPSVHALQQLRDGDVRAALAMAVLNQQGVPVGGCQLIVAGSSADFSTRFGARAKTAMLLLAGQMAQSIQLQAVSLDLTYLAVNNIDTLGVRRICRLDRALMPLYIAMVGYPASRAMGRAMTGTTTTATTTDTSPAETSPDEATPPASAKVVLITPQREFQDEELFQMKFALEAASIDVVVASSRSGRVLGIRGGVGQAELGLSQIKIEDFDALIFIGGPGAVPFASNTRVQQLVRRAVDEKKLLAAGGTAALILANAGVIKSAKVTGLAAHQPLFALAGAVYTGAAVERDGLLITSVGPLAATQFAQTIVEALTSQ
jgi:protease I